MKEYQTDSLKKLKNQPFYKKVLIIELQKYKQKSFKVLWAILHLYFLIAIIPKMLTIIWPFIQTNLSNKVLFIVGVTFANNFAIILINLIMCYVYFKNDKTNLIFYGQWPWQKNPKQWKSLLKQSLIRQAFTNFILLPAISVLLQLVVGQNFRYNQNFPGPIQILKQGLVFFIVQDLLNSTTHRIFHSKRFYWIHKKHHEYKQPISISAQYANPIQLVFGNFSASAAGLIILSFFQEIHIITVMIWIFFRVTDSILSHSGYNFDSSILQCIPFSTGSEFHSFHHTHNSGNIGSMLIIWDLLSGTYKDYVEYKINLMSQKYK